MQENLITIVSIVITVFATFFPFLHEWFFKSRNRDRWSQRGAWQMVEEVSRLDHIEDTAFTKQLRTSALRRAVRAEAVALTKSSTWTFPVSIGIYAGMVGVSVLGVFAIGWPALLFFLVYSTGTIFLTLKWLQARQLNRDKRIAIDLLIEEECPLVISDPVEAVEQQIDRINHVRQKRREKSRKLTAKLRQRVRRLTIRERDVARREREVSKREFRLGCESTQLN